MCSCLNVGVPVKSDAIQAKTNRSVGNAFT